MADTPRWPGPGVAGGQISLNQLSFTANPHTAVLESACKTGFLMFMLDCEDDLSEVRVNRGHLHDHESKAYFGRLDAGCLLVFIVLWYFLVAFRYEALPIQAWDESRNVVTSYEMSTGDNWLVPTYEGAPDHWQEKPPLLNWGIAAGMRAGLPMLLALRLPAFIAGFLTVVLVWVVGRYGIHDRIAGLTGGLLLLSSKLYFGNHVGRTGDYDVLLSLFTVAGVITFWVAIRGQKVHLGWFAGSGACVVLAVMTKGVAGIFAPVGLAMFALLTGRVWMLLSDYRAWLILLAAVVLSFSYYLIRELYDPGYIQAVWLVEMGGRFNVVNEGHAGSGSFYVETLWRRKSLGISRRWYRCSRQQRLLVCRI